MAGILLLFCVCPVFQFFESKPEGFTFCQHLVGNRPFDGPCDALLKRDGNICLVCFDDEIGTQSYYSFGRLLRRGLPGPDEALVIRASPHDPDGAAKERLENVERTWVYLGDAHFEIMRPAFLAMLDSDVSLAIKEPASPCEPHIARQVVRQRGVRPLATTWLYRQQIGMTIAPEAGIMLKTKPLACCWLAATLN